MMQKQVNGSTITVPVPNHPAIRIGTLQSIIRQSGIGRAHLALREEGASRED
jgi:predicted RNA binding protein YcfA (HicA-like mRNA interferase family)